MKDLSKDVSRINRYFRTYGLRYSMHLSGIVLMKLLLAALFVLQ